MYLNINFSRFIVLFFKIPIQKYQNASLKINPRTIFRDRIFSVKHINSVLNFMLWNYPRTKNVFNFHEREI